MSASPAFFPQPAPLTLADIAALTGAELRVGNGKESRAVITSVAPLDTAESTDISFIDNPKYLRHFATTCAGAVLVNPRNADKAPDTVALLVVADPYKAFALVAARLYPDAIKLLGAFGRAPVPAGAVIDPSANIEDSVVIEPGAVIGPNVGIGAGSVISANAVIGHDVQIGRNCHIGPNASLLHAFIGNDVIIHAGARIGSDGFGFASGPGGHVKIAQIGRVIVQDKVEVGANTCIDRGASRDTVIGEGTKIDNLVQIGHNVVIGRHCVICGNVGIAGSAILEDYVVLGGGAGVIGHVTLGMGARIAGSSNVAGNVPAGEDWAGTPAKPARLAFKEMMLLKRMAEGRKSKEKGEGA